MVIKQGSIIMVSFSPISGSEQAGYRPAVVISNETFNENTNFLIVLPVTNTDNGFPLHIPMGDRCKTKGFILCEHIRSIDSNSRRIKVIEQLPVDILKKVIALSKAEISLE
ncbi:MAG: type II toxin-antitoxin system PemK/MazF family toxin [Bacteroidales bacterium]|nr:type II toxin-antitoxin system PemK/MazF family toxin [Bacteroidales bacterium]